MAAIIHFEHPESEQALLHLIDLLNDWLEGNSELKRTFAIWIRAVLLRQRKHSLVLPKVRDLKELKMTLAERFDTWAQQHEQRGILKGIQEGIEQGIEKGIERGIEKGEALLLQRQLTRRFGALPNEVIVQIAGATSAQLERWGDRVLDAHTLDEVFSNH